MDSPAVPGLSELALERLGAMLPDPGPEAAPLAVFDADGTLWADDIGEDFFRWMIDARRLPGADYSRDLYGEYVQRCAVDKTDGYSSLGPMMAGLDEQTLLGWAADFFEAHYRRRIFAAAAGVIDRCHEAGWEVWVVTASVRQVVIPGAAALGIPAERVYGVAVEVDGGVLTDRLIHPISSGQGKADAVREVIGAVPALAAGNSLNDRQLLEQARGLGLVINPDAALEALAREQGWVVEQWLPGGAFQAS